MTRTRLGYHGRIHNGPPPDRVPWTLLGALALAAAALAGAIFGG